MILRGKILDISLKIYCLDSTSASSTFAPGRVPDEAELCFGTFPSEFRLASSDRRAEGCRGAAEGACGQLLGLRLETSGRPRPRLWGPRLLRACRGGLGALRRLVAKGELRAERGRELPRRERLEGLLRVTSGKCTAKVSIISIFHL